MKHNSQRPPTFPNAPEVGGNYRATFELEAIRLREEALTPDDYIFDPPLPSVLKTSLFERAILRFGIDPNPELRRFYIIE